MRKIAQNSLKYSLHISWISHNWKARYTISIQFGLCPTELNLDPDIDQGFDAHHGWCSTAAVSVDGLFEFYVCLYHNVTTKRLTGNDHRDGNSMRWDQNDVTDSNRQNIWKFKSNMNFELRDVFKHLWGALTACSYNFL